MNRRYLIWLFCIVAIIVCGIWALCGGLCEILKTNGKNVESVTALFSGLAFAGMIVAIVLQSKELSLQRQELAETRAELKRTAEANEKAAELSQKNIQQQERIANIKNSYTKNQILAQKYISELNNIYKKIEFSLGSNKEARYKESSEKIELLLKKLEHLKTLDGPISEDTGAMPEA